MDVYIKRRDVLSLAKKGYLVGNGNYQSVKNYINSIPAADVRPVVRGKWNTVKYPLYECSNCGAVYQEVGYGFNFCPNCGARMEG